jgi:pimeloyl-ACP methyl ester carboxylesterase
VLILAGEDDPVTPAAGSAELAHQLARAELRVFRGVGHGVLRQAPEAALAAIREFLRSIGY